MERRVSAQPGELSHDDAINLFSSSKVAMVLTNPRIEDNPIVYVNRAFERLTGYTSESAVGRNCRFLQGPATKDSDVQALRDAIEQNLDISIVLNNHRADGSEFKNSLLISPIIEEDTDETLYFLGLQREVEADPSGEKIAVMEELISEVQHRVKNHLSMILGLIRIKAREATAKEEFDDIARRIESLQLLYEELAAAQMRGNTDRVQLGSYLGRVAAATSHIDGRAGVRMNIDVAPVVVETEIAVRIGLIVSEILTNTMQHAFADQGTGLVELRVTETNDDGIRCMITDDGIGIPADVKWPSRDSLGGRIVLGLCEGIGATLNVGRGAVGTVITLDVPNARKKEL
ncbi:PAS domain-containing protein [Alphaproteobacteria bacterium GH1-50]|uniref:histidine kinase n=1 Tax=Kangsaoukella pontilimi TaxID=2691042 RepID=A0A7C9ME77_9RHOB|nr:PAS domain-containing protein [Kangsaoukella pontilimi]MXQ08751.1 PAS domain-containing protein [Kangsaoukella pontilimi]